MPYAVCNDIVVWVLAGRVYVYGPACFDLPLVLIFAEEVVL
jgi:hypothetical protein